MKKTIIAASIAAASLSGCQMTPEPKQITIGETGYTVTQTDSEVAAEFSFDSINDYMADLNTKASQNLWNKDKLSKEVDFVRDTFGNGTFTVTAYSYSLGEASDGYICALLVQNLEAIDKSCMNGTASTPSGRGDYSDRWWNISTLLTSKLDTTEPFEIRVNSSVTHKMTRFKFEPTSHANQLTQ